MIKFTIITCTFNAEKELPQTLQSVMRQDYPHVEHLIIDGASKDNTLTYVQKYQNSSETIDNGHKILLISESDKGLYDAMNKGLKKATGDFILFLNAGDKFHDNNTLSLIVSAAEKEEKLPGIIYGNTNIINNEGKFLHPRRLHPPTTLSWKSFRKGMLVCHQAFFTSKELTNNCLYNLSYHYSADFDWCIRIMKLAEQQKLPITNTNIIITDYLEGGLTTKNHRRSLLERFNIMVDHYGTFQTILLHLYFILRAIGKK